MGQGTTLRAASVDAAVGVVSFGAGKLLGGLRAMGARVYYRAIAAAEATAISKGAETTGQAFLRGGRAGETYWTNVPYSSKGEEMKKLSLQKEPEVMSAFRIKNKLELTKDATVVRPDFGQPGGGIEFCSREQVQVEMVGVKPLGP